MKRIHSEHFDGLELFRWVPMTTEPKAGGLRHAGGSTSEWWYEFDPKAAAKVALKARNAAAREWALKGYTVRKHASGYGLRSKGGIGTEYPHIEFHAKSYGFDVYEA